VPHGEIPLVPARSATRSNRSLLGRTYITSIQQFDKNSFGGCPLFADPVRKMFVRDVCGDTENSSVNCLGTVGNLILKLYASEKRGYSASRIKNSFCKVTAVLLLSKHSHDCGSPSTNCPDEAR